MRTKCSLTTTHRGNNYQYQTTALCSALGFKASIAMVNRDRRSKGRYTLVSHHERSDGRYSKVKDCHRHHQSGDALKKAIEGLKPIKKKGFN